jgi:hypothetical protein
MILTSIALLAHRAAIAIAAEKADEVSQPVRARSVTARLPPKVPTES